MKKIILAVGMLCLVATACSKKDDNKTVTPANTNNTNTNNTNTNTTTNSLAGDWTIVVYDGGTVVAPEAGTIKTTGTSATEGTVKFDLTFDGTNHDTEEDTYVLSSSNTKVDFTKTGGTKTTLSGGKTWTIDTLTSNRLVMTSGYGLIIKCTK